MQESSICEDRSPGDTCIGFPVVWYLVWGMHRNSIIQNTPLSIQFRADLHLTYQKEAHLKDKTKPNPAKIKQASHTSHYPNQGYFYQRARHLRYNRNQPSKARRASPIILGTTYSTTTTHPLLPHAIKQREYWANPPKMNPARSTPLSHPSCLHPRGPKKFC